MKKTISLILALLMLVTVFAGCSGADEPEQEPEQEPAENSQPAEEKAPEDYEGTIIFWSWGEDETRGLEAAFNTVYPNIHFEYVPVEYTAFPTKFTTALLSGSELPDVCLQDISVRGSMFALDCWENLEAEPYNFDRSIVFPQILPTMVNSRDEVIAIDRELNPSGIYYKRDLAKKFFGTDDPDELAKLWPTWDEFIDLCIETKETYKEDIFMFSGLSELYTTLTGQYSGVIFENKAAHVSDFYLNTFTVMTKLRDAGLVNTIVHGTPAATASHLDEIHVMYPCAPWSPTWYCKASDPDGAGRWGVTTMPGGAYSNGGTAYAIPSDAANKELAWQFIKWSTCTKEGAEACTLGVVGAISSCQAVYADGMPDGSDEYFAGQDYNKFLMENCLPDMEIRPISEYDMTLSDVLSLVSDMIANDPTLTAEAATQIAVDEITQKLPADFTVD